MEALSKEVIEKIIIDLHKKFPITEQVKFNEFDIHEKLEKNGNLLLMYSDMLIKEETYLESIEELMEKLIGNKYDHYRFESDKNLQKVEIERYYLPKDPDILKMKNIIAHQKLRVKFFKMCVNVLNKQQWNIKTFSDNMRSGY